LRWTTQWGLTIREAISRLVSIGLVQMEDQRGYRIAPVSVENLREVVALRATLETQALKESILYADLEWESAVLGGLHRLNRAPPDREDSTPNQAWEEAHLNFHSALIANCRMPMLLELCRTLFDLNARYMHIFDRDGFSDRDDGAEHGAIANAAVARDVEKSIALLGAHIERTGNVLAGKVETALNETQLMGYSE